MNFVAKQRRGSAESALRLSGRLPASHASAADNLTALLNNGGSRCRYSDSLASLAIVVSLGSIHEAHATKFWKNSVANGNWSTGANWSATSAAGADNGGVPVPSEVVNIINADGVAHTLTYDVDAPTLGLLTINFPCWRQTLP